MNELTLLRAIHFGWRDALQVALVAILLYQVLRFVPRTRAMQFVAGVLLVLATYTTAWALQLSMIVFVLDLVLTYGVFALLIVFQPELRSALMRPSKARAALYAHFEPSPVEDEIADAIERLAGSSTGAIIAIERASPLSEYVESGSAMEAKLSADLLATIFTPYSPLHDGAVIVRGDSIIGAGCILPLSQAAVADRSLGTRHRAALGLSEDTDALVIVVSEERGTITVAQGGRLLQNLTPLQVRDLIGGRAMRVTAEHVVSMA